MKSLSDTQLQLPILDILASKAPLEREKRPRSSAIQQPCDDRILRRADVQMATGLSRTAIYRLIAAKDFPEQVRLSTNTVGWLHSEVNAWIASRVAASRQLATKPSTKARS